MPMKVTGWKLARLAIRIIDSISSASFFFFRLKKTRYPATEQLPTYTKIMQHILPYFDLLAEILHITVPIEIGRVKFGPGEILVAAQDKSEADIELNYL